MNQIRAFSSPAVLPAPSNPTTPTSPQERPEDHSLDGIATNVKLLLKLIQDHNAACGKDQYDRKAQRVAGMMTILDDVKTRIQKSQSVGIRRAELRRCKTDLKKPPEPIDEKERLRRQLSASSAALKSLEIMCSSLGKEKEIIATELARKVQEVSGMEEHMNDLRAQNEMLLSKLQACAAEHNKTVWKRGNGEIEMQGNVAALQERNKELSEQLLKSLDACKSLKRKVKEGQKENSGMQATMEEGLVRIHALKEKFAASHDKDIEEEILRLELLFGSWRVMISKHDQNKEIGECTKRRNEVDAT